MPVSCTKSLAGFGWLLVVAAIVLAGCTDRSELPPTGAIDQDTHATTLGSQARVWLHIENAENTYVGQSEDDWLTDSYVTEAGAFDVVMTNTTGFDVEEVYLLVTVPAEVLDPPVWWVEVDGIVIDPGDFTGTDTDLFGFDGGSHGVYPPSGTGVFFPYPMGGTLFAEQTWTISVRASSGGNEGFKVHFDAGSTRLYNPASHDATALPPDQNDDGAE